MAAQEKTEGLSNYFPPEKAYLFDEKYGIKVVKKDATLGSGTYGVVSKYVRKSDGKLTDSEVAVKIIKANKVGDAAKFRTELETMAAMDHPNVVHLYEVYQDKNEFKLIMELCTGGELFDAIIEAESFTEDQARHLVKQMVSSVHYCHEKNIVHRDLKPENFLLAKKGSDPMDFDIKLIDFGLAKKFTPGQIHTTKAGTPYYVAPQVLEGKYGEKCDVWSLGVITFIMLCGSPPFYGDTDGEILRKVRKGAYQFDPAEWSTVSMEAKHAIAKMLTKKEADRPTAKEILSTTWLTQKAVAGADAKVLRGVVSNMKKFTDSTNFKKAVLMQMAQQISQADDQDVSLKALQAAFKAVDTDGGGTLSFDEMTEAIANLSGDSGDIAQLKQILNAMDQDKNQQISYTEFLAAAVDTSKLLSGHAAVSRMAACFAAFDVNNDGKLDNDEVMELLAKIQGIDQTTATADVTKALQAEVKDIFSQVDTNKDGYISKQEFEDFLKMSEK